MKKANRSGTERETGCPFAEGSVTVETALVMPLLLVTVLSVLYLTIHVRNGCCITSSCIEQAISGRTQKDPDLFFSGGIERADEESSSQRTVSMSAETIYFSGQVLWSTGSKRTYKKYYPVSYLRKIRGAGNLIAGD
ncbi:MAG TPA: hypothetical protein DCG37_02620 [Lachnospiraceae bacterium]|nr:hypothetical protein [Lachnospiraceae bacterium]